MERYKVKIENKYNNSSINKNYTFPIIEEGRKSPYPLKQKCSFNVSPTRGNKTENRQFSEN